MSAPNTTLVRREAVPEKLSSVPDDFPLISIVEENRAMLSAKLPHGYTLEGMLVELYFAAQKQPDLLKLHPNDLIPALVEALDTGGTIGKDVYLLTFSSRKKATPDVVVALNYQFKAELVVRAGGARAIDAVSVYSKEPFALNLGTNPSIRHQPLSPSARGHLIGAYAVAQLGHGVVKVQWCDQESIEKLRAKSRSWKDDALKQKGEPIGCPEWYGPKTAVHRLVKLLPKNPKLTRILGKIQQEEELEFGADPADEVAQIDPPARIYTPGAKSHDTESFAPPAGLEDESEDEGDRGATMTIAEACAITVERDRPLSTYRNSALRKLQDWARLESEEKGEDPRWSRLIMGCTLILAARERGELAEPSSKTA